MLHRNDKFSKKWVKRGKETATGSAPTYSRSIVYDYKQTDHTVGFVSTILLTGHNTLWISWLKGVGRGQATRTPLSSSTVSPCCSTAHASVPLTNRNVFRKSRSLGLSPKRQHMGKKGRHGHTWRPNQRMLDNGEKPIKGGEQRRRRKVEGKQDVNRK